MKQLFVDCDGVLADFDGEYERTFGERPSRTAWSGKNKRWEALRAADHFYARLPVLNGAFLFMNALRDLRPIILTGCPAGGWAEADKIAWGKEFFPGVPLVTCRSREKCLFARPYDVLVDDWTKYKLNWEGAGGTFIHFTGDYAATLDDIARYF